MAVTPTAFLFETKTSNKKDLEILSMDTPWRIDCSIDWLSLSAKVGTTSSSVQIDASENRSGDEARLGIFYVKSDVDDWEYETPVTVSQSRAVPYIIPSQSEFDLPGNANEKSFSVSSNCSWDVLSNSSWLSVYEKDGHVSFSTTANETSSYRNAIITLTHNGDRNTSSKVTVRQAPSTITASAESWLFNNTAGTANLIINAETPWTASSSSSWMDISPTSGISGTSTLKIDVSPNVSTEYRIGYVIISIGTDQRIQIPVKQRGLYIDIDKTAFVFKAIGETQELRISSNTSWSFSDIPSWITLSKSSGNGDALVEITAKENNSADERIESFRLMKDGTSDYTTISIRQAGRKIDINPTEISFTSKASSQNLKIVSDGQWQVTSQDLWISVSPATGFGNSEIIVAVTENTEDVVRVGNLAVTMGGKTTNVSVKQEGKYLTISNNVLSYTSKGGTIEITVSSDDVWTARVEDEVPWINISQTSGNETAKIKVIASDNPSVQKRSGVVIIETIHGQSIKVLLNQDARYLAVNSHGLLFYSKGGTSEPITVSSDGIFEIQTTQPWIQITRSANIFVTTINQNTTGVSRMGSVVIRLTDLEDGILFVEIPVSQLEDGHYFFLEEYLQDIDYNIANGNNWSIKLASYGSETDYNSSGTNGVNRKPVEEQGDITDGNSTGIDKGTTQEQGDINCGSGSGIDKDSYNSDKDYDN